MSEHAEHGHDDLVHMVEDFKKRLFISLIIIVPILILSPMIQELLGVDWHFPYNLYILLVLLTFTLFYGDGRLLLMPLLR